MKERKVIDVDAKVLSSSEDEPRDTEPTELDPADLVGNLEARGLDVREVAPGLTVIGLGDGPLPDDLGDILRAITGVAGNGKGAGQACEFDASGRCVTHDSPGATRGDELVFDFMKAKRRTLEALKADLTYLDSQDPDDVDPRLRQLLLDDIEYVKGSVIKVAEVIRARNPDMAEEARGAN